MRETTAAVRQSRYTYERGWRTPCRLDTATAAVLFRPGERHDPIMGFLPMTQKPLFPLASASAARLVHALAHAHMSVGVWADYGASK